MLICVWKMWRRTRSLEWNQFKRAWWKQEELFVLLLALIELILAVGACLAWRRPLKACLIVRAQTTDPPSTMWHTAFNILTPQPLKKNTALLFYSHSRVQSTARSCARAAQRRTSSLRLQSSVERIHTSRRLSGEIGSLLPRWSLI